jgi:arsenate reductase-like glutaredoxin family protein
MKIKHLLTWVQDNNIVEEINTYIKSHPPTRKTLKWVEEYIDSEFDKMEKMEDEIDERMKEYKKCVTPENAELLIEDSRTQLQIYERMKDLDYIATYIETHKPK